MINRESYRAMLIVQAGNGDLNAFRELSLMALGGDSAARIAVDAFDRGDTPAVESTIGSETGPASQTETGRGIRARLQVLTHRSS